MEIRKLESSHLEGGNLKKMLWRNMRQMKIKGIED